MATKIVMYTGNTCGKCKRAKAMLESCPVDVEIIERNVDETPGLKLYMENILDSKTLPTFTYETIVQEYGENKIKINVLRGFDENIGKIMEVLGL
ncbi:glutaredoxin family protein [Bacillus toyonensis]|uniref:glutaredoxin family protein n=1 Tax=Bacillus toyonensis TaxID=155322 RepID=UPI002175B796|nr:glutaredoxin [Bacillus toyonensis]